MRCGSILGRMEAISSGLAFSARFTPRRVNKTPSPNGEIRGRVSSASKVFAKNRLNNQPHVGAKQMYQGDQHADAPKRADHLSEDVKQHHHAEQCHRPTHLANRLIKQDHSQPLLDASNDNEFAHHTRVAGQGSNEFTCQTWRI